jgi:hypothetical protein
LPSYDEIAALSMLIGASQKKQPASVSKTRPARLRVTGFPVPRLIDYDRLESYLTGLNCGSRSVDDCCFITSIFPSLACRSGNPRCVGRCAQCLSGAIARLSCAKGMFEAAVLHKYRKTYENILRQLFARTEQAQG